MKTRPSRRQTAKVSHSRWLAYATAGAATALVGSNSAEAAIHYSGRLHVHFPPNKEKTKTFPLDQAGDYLFFRRGLGNYHDGVDFVGTGAFFTCVGIVSGRFRGPSVSSDNYYDYVSKLRFGENISAGLFQAGGYAFGILAARYHNFYAQWGDRGDGFVGFRFNSGMGRIRYGWARVRMVGDPESAFAVLDYAYADPGEPIRAGEGIPAGEDGQDMSDEQGPDEGSLGGLALGAVGLLAWRKSRSRTAS